MHPSTDTATDWLTDRPAPYFPGLYGVQAVDTEPDRPDVTIYRRRFSDADHWISNVGRRRRFTCFLLQRDRARWDIYNASGERIGPCKGNPVAVLPESLTGIKIDRKEFVEEARAIIGDPGLTLLACVEGHAGASAADHSNFRVICHRMIERASPADLEQFYLFDSRRWPCRVAGVFANVANLSPEIQDTYLDRVSWLENSWPLTEQYFQEILADRLATVRSSYTFRLLQDCAQAARMSEKKLIGLRSKWLMASPGPKYRFALHLVETLQKGLVHEKCSAETFSTEIVRRHGKAVVDGFKRRLTLGLK